MTRAKRSKRNWMVTVCWEDGNQSFELMVKDKLTEVEAIDEMIAREKAYAGTGRTFCAVQMQEVMS